MAQAITPGAMGAPAAPPDDMGEEDPAAMGAGADTAEGGDEGDVLLTVLKTPDGTYQLIEGDEDEAAGEGGEPPKTFDSKGSLLKAILDILNEDESAEGAPGSADDQFQSGFDENTPPKPAAPVPQKY